MPDFEINDDLVRRLASLLEQNSLTEIEYETGGHRIRIARNQQTSVAPILTVGAAPQELPAVHGATPQAASAAAEAAPSNAVTSPMVGTVYLSPEPNAPHFVSPGDTVSEGQTLLIIEAMKVMNQIPSPRAGRVVRVLVEDGQPVEFGEPLVVVE